MRNPFERGSSARIRRHEGAIIAAAMLTAVPVAAAPPHFEVIHDFTSDEGCYPNGAMVFGADGNLYGTLRGCPSATIYSAAAIYRATPEGDVTILYRFMGNQAYSYPNGVTLGPDGALYGTTYAGGNWGEGSVFRFSADGEFQVLFADFGLKRYGFAPGALVVTPSGELFAPVYGGGGGMYAGGLIFNIDASGTLRILHTFHHFSNQYKGTNPMTLAVGPDGNLYGTLLSDPDTGAGIFEMSPDGKTFHGRALVDAGEAAYGIAMAGDGTMYGTSSFGGKQECPAGCGTLWRITSPSGQAHVLHRFHGGDGLQPQTLIIASDGNLYGTTYGYGRKSHSHQSQGGTVFRYSADGGFETIHNFKDTGGKTSGLIESPQGGALYGVAGSGGKWGNGTLFRITPGD